MRYTINYVMNYVMKYAAISTIYSSAFNRFTFVLLTLLIMGFGIFAQ